MKKIIALSLALSAINTNVNAANDLTSAFITTEYSQLEQMNTPTGAIIADDKGAQRWVARFEPPLTVLPERQEDFNCWAFSCLSGGSNGQQGCIWQMMLAIGDGRSQMVNLVLRAYP